MPRKGLGYVSHAIPNDAKYFARLERLWDEEWDRLQAAFDSSVLAAGSPPGADMDSELKQWQDLNLLRGNNDPMFWNDPRDQVGDPTGPQATYARLALKYGGESPAVGTGGLLA